MQIRQTKLTIRGCTCDACSKGNEILTFFEEGSALRAAGFKPGDQVLVIAVADLLNGATEPLAALLKDLP
jgi:hypothetical protein